MSGVRQKWCKRYKQRFSDGFLIICGICKSPITSIDEITVDHIHPKSLGGKNARNNFQPAHTKCNNEKGNNPVTIA